LAPFLHSPLLLGPASLQKLVMEIDGSHGKTLRECERWFGVLAAEVAGWRANVRRTAT
jgi:hypothetical protein